MYKLIYQARKNDPSILSSEGNFTEFMELVQSFVSLQYEENMEAIKQEINNNYIHAYKRPLLFKKNRTAELFIEIKRFMLQTSKTIEEIVKEIRSYLGYNCSFFRFEDRRTVPIDSERIKRAHELITKKASFIKVEDALYL